MSNELKSGDFIKYMNKNDKQVTAIFIREEIEHVNFFQNENLFYLILQKHIFGKFMYRMNVSKR